MKKNLFIISMFTVLVFAGGAFACPCQNNEKQKSTMMERKTLIAEHHDDHKGVHHDKEMAKSEAMNVGNTICPVSGQSVEAMGAPYNVEYNGKVYNLCCKSCAKAFKKDPEKYSKIAEEKVKK